jgi:acyl-CoA synthetase (AMP-forming)/AMP-acid ligase II
VLAFSAERAPDVTALSFEDRSWNYRELYADVCRFAHGLGELAGPFCDSWFHSGDLARKDADGYFYIVDRKKDMILTGGENVYSREVEEVLHHHPAVAAAAVVGHRQRCGASGWSPWSSRSPVRRRPRRRSASSVGSGWPATSARGRWCP